MLNGELLVAKKRVIAGSNATAQRLARLEYVLSLREELGFCLLIEAIISENSAELTRGFPGMLRFGSKCLIANGDEEIKFGVHVGATTVQEQQQVKIWPTPALAEALELPTSGSPISGKISVIEEETVARIETLTLQPSAAALVPFRYRPSTLHVVRALNGLIFPVEGSRVRLSMLDGSIATFDCKFEPKSAKYGELDPNLSTLRWQESSGEPTSSQPSALPLHRPLRQSLEMMLQFHLHKELTPTGSVASALRIPQKILLWGPIGSGKTTLVHDLALSNKLPLIVLNPSVWNRRAGEESSPGNLIFREAIASAPAIILFDDLDLIITEDVTGDTEGQVKSNTEWFQLMQRINDSHQVVIVATTDQIDEVSVNARRMFDKEIHIDHIGPKERQQLLSQSTPQFSDSELALVTSKLHGFSVFAALFLVPTPAHAFLSRSDVKRLVINAHINGILQNRTPASVEDYELALKQIRPSAIQQFSPVLTSQRWADIGGLREVKEKLKQATVWVYEKAEAFERLGISPPRGLLLHGPSGTGKTACVKAIATESKANFIYVSVNDVTRSELGESERAIAEIFRSARKSSPCIVFFDEFQSMFGTKDSAEHHSTNMIAQLSLEMDAIGSSPGVLVVAAANRLDSIDKSFLRPGRFDVILQVPLPDESDRKDILTRHLETLRTSAEVKSAQFVDKLAKLSLGMTGADLKSLFAKAAIMGLRSDPNCSEITETMLLQVLTPSFAWSLGLLNVKPV